MTGAISRRRFLQDAGVATTSLASSGALTASSGAARRRRRRQTVAVFGGGIAGMTAAHELAERGFDVTLYERRAWGGKARSTSVPRSATGGRKPLPGEHAYRVEFGCYQNLPDTMRRIPFGSNPNGVFDNMVEVPQFFFARTDKHDVPFPPVSLSTGSLNPALILELLQAALIDMQIPPDGAAYFANRMAVFMSSCDARRYGEWERTTWSDFIGADRFGGDYRAIFERLPEFIQASKADDSSAKYIAAVFMIWLIYGELGRGTNGPALRVLNLPTDEAWIDPWVAHLRRLGVRLRLGHEVARLEVRGGRIAAARLRTPRGRRTAVADWYVCALPVERATRLWNRKLLAIDPDLAQMRRLSVAWMNGISYFVRERTQILRGIVACGDSPWACSFIPQAQFWNCDFARTYGDGTVKDKVSAAIANWDAPGVLYGRPARELPGEQVALDLWEQIKRHVNTADRAERLTDAMLHSWEIDPGMLIRDNRLVSGDPLVLPTAGTERYRPAPTTGLPNLMLCGDYLDGEWEIANMEAPCYNGRRAANAILERAGSGESPATVVGLYRPPEWEPLRRVDEDRWRRGQPNLFDGEMSGDRRRTLLAGAGRR